VYVSTRATHQHPVIVRFDSEKLTAGKAERCENGGGTPLVSYGMPQGPPMIRIVDPETRIERSAGTVGEIWVHGDNVAMGYWQKPDETESTFGERLSLRRPTRPRGLGCAPGTRHSSVTANCLSSAASKDLLIVYGRNHSPDDIEATIQEITGRCAAIAVPNSQPRSLLCSSRPRSGASPPRTQ